MIDIAIETSGPMRRMDWPSASCREITVEEAVRIGEAVGAQITHATGCRHCVVHVDPDGTEADSLEELGQQEEM